MPEYPPVLVICSNDTDRTWIAFRCGWLFKLLAGRIEMSSGSFLKSVSESNLDKLYDLPESIQDVMGLQALRPSAAVCKVMTIPDSNCVRIVMPTGFHEILIYDMGQEDWPKVPLSEIGCLRLDWPKDLFSFVGRYQLELEHMRKECRDLVRARRVKSSFKLTSVSTWLCITWTWHSYGAAPLAGVRFGKGHLKTVWTTCAEHTILHFR